MEVRKEESISRVESFIYSDFCNEKSVEEIASSRHLTVNYVKQVVEKVDSHIEAKYRKGNW